MRAACIESSRYRTKMEIINNKQIHTQQLPQPQSPFYILYITLCIRKRAIGIITYYNIIISKDNNIIIYCDGWYSTSIDTILYYIIAFLV